jgi:hypothetical protein
MLPKPIGFRLGVGQVDALDAHARRSGTSRSAIVRQAVDLLLTQLALREHECASLSPVDPHVVNIVIPVVDDGAPERVKSAVAARNAATLAGHCPVCEAEPRVVSAVIDAELVKVPAGAAKASSAHVARPSTSPPPPPSQRPPPRTSVTVRFDHHPSCPASGGSQ